MQLNYCWMKAYFTFLPSRKPSWTLHIIAFICNTHIIGCCGGIGKREAVACWCTSRTLFLPVGDRNWNQQIYMESICIDGKGHNNSRFIVLACYRFPTKNKPIDFLPSLYSAAEYLYNIRNELLIISDLNFNMLAAGGSEPDPHLVEFWDRFCMSNIITEPTPETNCSISLTDFIFTGDPECFALSGKMKLGLSDHDLNFTIRKQKIFRPSPKSIEYRSMRGFERDYYIADLSTIPWYSVNIYDEIDDIYEHWHHLFIKAVDQHLPFKRKCIRGDQLP